VAMTTGALDLIDTHLHLDADEFASDREAVIKRAQSAGVNRFLIPSVWPANFTTVRDLAARLPGSVFALGVHPMYVEQTDDSAIVLLRAALQMGGACAVGEIGLDGFVEGADTARQEWFFAEQLKLAREFDLPVVLHVRRAQDRVLKYLRRHRVRGGIAHAFNGSLQQAETFIELGFKLGFGGAMTYSGSTRIRELARTLPLESIVLESDAPDIPPAWLAGGRNEPGEVAKFAQVLAELRGIREDEVAAVTTRNAEVVLGLN